MDRLLGVGNIRLPCKSWTVECQGEILNVDRVGHHQYQLLKMSLVDIQFEEKRDFRRKPHSPLEGKEIEWRGWVGSDGRGGGESEECREDGKCDESLLVDGGGCGAGGWDI